MRPPCLLLACLLPLPACAPVDLLNGVAPTWGYQAPHTGVPYGDDPRQVLDVYRPRQDAPAPVVVFFYGGRWEGGERKDFRFVADALASRGFLVVIPDYRVYPQVTFPGFVEDGARAVRWARDHAAEEGGDPHRLFLMGHSSGAHTALMLALDHHFLRDAGVAPAEIQGAIGLAGPYNFLPFDPDIQLVMGPEKQWPATQPVAFADGTSPPLLLLQGDADDIVKPHNAVDLEAAVTAHGGQVQRKSYPGVDHYKILVALAAPLRFLAPTLDDVTTWLRARLD